VVPKKVEQINDYLFIDMHLQAQWNKINGMNEMMVNDSEMSMR